MPTDVVYKANEPDQTALVATYVPTVHTENLEEKSDRIALAHNIATSTLRNLVWSESRWNPNADNGYDRGLTQINRAAWPQVTDSEAFDPEFALNFAADKIAHHQESYWVVCNCYALVKTRILDLPATKDLIPNSKIKVGSVALFNYEGIKHYAYVEEIYADSFKIDESNYKPCLRTNRIVQIDDPRLIGFWSK